MKTYVIYYEVYFTSGKSETHSTKVKNCENEMYAKVKLEKWLRKKHANFDRLEVHAWREDVMDIFSMFGDSNPFR